jgi:toxin YoeB
MLNICFTPASWDDYRYWQTQDRKTFKRINKLLKESANTPFTGTGKPEKLRHNLSGYWSRRIDSANRMVYHVNGSELWIIQLRYHY